MRTVIGVALIVTVAPFTMMTLSPELGTTFPTQVVVALQLPPVDVLVIVPAFAQVPASRRAAQVAKVIKT